MELNANNDNTLNINQAATPDEASEIYIQPAGFNERFIAYVIDAVPFLLCHLFTVAFLKHSGNPPQSVFPIMLVWIFLYLLYHTIFASGGRATLGKYLMNIRVVSKDGQPLPFIKSGFRAFCYFLSGAPVQLGFLLALITPEHRALHDIFSGSKVISIKERGDLADGLIIALSWALMAFLGGAWVHNNVLKIGPQEKKQIMAAHRTISKIGVLEEIYYKQNGSYTNDLQVLANMTGNVDAVKSELIKNLDYQHLEIISGGKDYTIRAKAKNWRRTVVEIKSRKKN